MDSEQRYKITTHDFLDLGRVKSYRLLVAAHHADIIDFWGFPLLPGVLTDENF